MNWLVLILCVVVLYLGGKILEERQERKFEVERWKSAQLLREAGLDARLFCIGSSVSSDEEELPETERLHRVIHRPSGKLLLLKSGGRFFEWQNSVYNGPPLYPELGGIIVSGTECQKLVEIDRARALAKLEE